MKNSSKTLRTSSIFAFLAKRGFRGNFPRRGEGGQGFVRVSAVIAHMVDVPLHSASREREHNSNSLKKS